MTIKEKVLDDGVRVEHLPLALKPGEKVTDLMVDGASVRVHVTKHAKRRFLIEATELEVRVLRALANNVPMKALRFALSDDGSRKSLLRVSEREGTVGKLAEEFAAALGETAYDDIVDEAAPKTTAGQFDAYAPTPKYHAYASADVPVADTCKPYLWR
jgi:hypothetical protein